MPFQRTRENPRRVRTRAVTHLSSSRLTIRAVTIDAHDASRRATRARPTAALLAVTLLVVAAAVSGAPGYARLAAPGIDAVARAIAAWNSWRVDLFAVVDDPRGVGSRLELTTTVPAYATPTTPHARVVARESAAGPARGAAVVIALVLLWPSRRARSYLTRLAIALPATYLMTALAHGAALSGSTAYAAAQMAREAGQTPLLARWADFSQAGGTLALAILLGLLTVAAADAVGRRWGG